MTDPERLAALDTASAVPPPADRKPAGAAT